MRGHARHRTARLGQPATARAERAERRERLRRLVDPRRVGRVKPRKPREFVDAERHRLEHRAREVDARDLGHRVRVAALVLGDAPQANRAPGRGAPRAARALLCACLRDWLDAQRVESAQRVVAVDAREARVDHRAHAVDREARLRDIRRHDDAAAFRGVDRAHRAILLLGRQRAVQRQHLGRDARARERDLRLLAGAHDLVRARHEHEEMPRVIGLAARIRVEHALDRGASEVPRRVARRPREMLDRDGIRAPLGEDRLAREESLEPLRLERGARHDHAEVLAPRLLRELHEPERDIDRDRALVKLVEHDSAHARKRRVALQLSHEQSIGDESDARLLRHAAIVARLVADEPAEFAAEFVRHPRGQHARGKPPWLEHDDIARNPRAIEQKLRQLRALARARRRDDHEPVPRGNRGADRIAHALDRKFFRRLHAGAARVRSRSHATRRRRVGDAAVRRACRRPNRAPRRRSRSAARSARRRAGRCAPPTRSSRPRRRCR